MPGAHIEMSVCPDDIPCAQIQVSSKSDNSAQTQVNTNQC